MCPHAAHKAHCSPASADASLRPSPERPHDPPPRRDHAPHPAAAPSAGRAPEFHQGSHHFPAESRSATPPSPSPPSPSTSRAAPAPSRTARHPLRRRRASPAAPTLETYACPIALSRINTLVCSSTLGCSIAKVFLHPSTRHASFAISPPMAATKSPAGRMRVGLSGWNYAPRRGVFYPQKLPHTRELAYAAERFSTIEINGTFYSLQRPTSFARWAAATPDDFVFSVKGSRYITHMLRLRNAEQALANFFASGLLLLGSKLGPILWQFPPHFVFDASLLEEFFQLPPSTTAEAALLGRRHDSRLEGRAHTETDKN